MKKLIALLLALSMVFALCACGAAEKEETAAPAAAEEAAAPAEETAERKNLTMWFWGTSDYQRTAMDKYLVEGFNNSQDEYTLTVEYRASVDNDIVVALSGGEGPDIIYGSGPAFVAGYAAEGLLVNMDKYAEQYGWKDRVVDAFYDLCTVDGSLYSLPGALSGIGVFYNKALLEENGWAVPTTFEELTAVMDSAIEAGLYGGIIGAKDWRYTNDWPISMLLASVAGPEAVYKVLSGEQKWNSPEIAAAVEEMNTWYQKGYIGGDDYWNYDANESCMLLVNGQTPFFFAPLNGFQWIKNVATEEQMANVGFMPIPSKQTGEPAVMIGSVCTFSINANSENPDGAAAVLDYMMTADFASSMTSEWPGYWGLPVKELADMNPADYSGLSVPYLQACIDCIAALNSGNFGYMASGCFPAVTYETSIDIDTVWFGDKTVDEYLDSLDAAYAEDVAAGSVIDVPKPTF